MENRLDSVFCHVLGTSRLGRGSKTCSRCDCLAGFCICKQHSAGQMAQLVSCLWHSRIWNYFMRWLCETGNSQWLWTGRFEKNTPRFSHVKSRLNLQRALGFHGFLQSSPWFVRRCCLVLVGDVVFLFIFFKISCNNVSTVIVVNKINAVAEATRVVPCVQQLLQVADRDLTTTMAERFRMGPFYSWEVRKELKEVHVAYVDGNQSKRYKTKHAAMSSNFNQLPQIIYCFLILAYWL